MWKQWAKLKEQYLNQRIMDAIDYEKFCMISIVYHSSKIEGCSLTEADTKILLENNLTAYGKSLTDHLMIKDHYHAFLKLRHESTIKRKLTIDLIKEINAAVMHSTGCVISAMAGNFDTAKGDLRLAQVYVEQKYFPDYTKIPGLLQKLVDAVNAKIDLIQDDAIVKLAADIHYNLINIHPFGDGNGRTSRLLMNYIQLYHGAPLIKIFTEDRMEYIAALNETESEQNLNIFRDFICRQQMKFFTVELDKYNKSKSEAFLLLE